MGEPAEKTHLLPERIQRLVGLAKDKFPVLVLPGEPVPVSDPVFFLGKRHSVGAVYRAKTAGWICGDFLSHRLKERQWQDDS
jgi:hypothetical protein